MNMQEATKNFFEQLRIAVNKDYEMLKKHYSPRFFDENYTLIEKLATGAYKLIHVEESTHTLLPQWCMKVTVKVDGKEYTLTLYYYSDSIVSIRFENIGFEPFIEGQEGIEAMKKIEHVYLEQLLAVA